MQHLIKFCFNINDHKADFWRLVCGANRFDNNSKQFHYKRIKFDINLPRYALYRSFLSHLIRWINYVYRANNNEISVRYLSSQHNTIPTDDLIYHLRSDTLNEYLAYEDKFRDDDIIISGDSSHDKNTGLTGIGVFIKDRDVFHRFCEPIGSVTNNFGELFAIGKGDFLLKFFNVNTFNRRIFVITDSLCSFCPLITPPKNIDKQIKHAPLFKTTQKYLKRMNAILWKMKSHTDLDNIPDNRFHGIPRVQPYNGEADRLADLGRLHPCNASGIPFDLDSIKYAQYSSKRCLNCANNIHIVRMILIMMILLQLVTVKGWNHPSLAKPISAEYTIWSCHNTQSC